MPFAGPFERLVAVRYLRRRRQEGFVSVIAGFSLIGIALGVATLIIVMAVMNGFREELLSRILGLNGHVGVYAAGNAPLTDFDDLTVKIRGIKGVGLVIPTVEGQVLVSSDHHAQGAMVRAMRPEDLDRRTILSEDLSANALAAFREGGVLVGHRLASRLNLRPGDAVTLISPRGRVTAFGAVPRIKSYPIAATFDVGMFEYDANFIFMPLEPAQVYFRLPDAVSHLEVFLTDATRLTEITPEILGLTERRLSLYDWKAANAAFFNAVEVERNVMFLILTLIILVAAFNIVSGLIMLVKDKGQDIAILRTMGASKGMIMRIFFMSGAFIGVVGTSAGTVLGLLFCRYIEEIRRGIEALLGADLFSAEIYFLSRLPAIVDPQEVVAVVLMALGLSFAATLYPSWRAARLDPVEGIRRG